MYDYELYANDIGLTDAAAATTATALITIYAVCIGIALLIGLACYLINAIALYRMAKRTGVKHAWLGFIPLADYWLLGRVSDVGSARRHSGARLLGFSVASVVSASAYLGSVIAIIVGLLANGVLDGEVSDEALLASIMPGITSAIVLVVIMLICSLCTTIFTCMAYYRVAANFGGTSATGYGVALILTLFFCQIATFIILLVLSGKTPAATEGIPTAAEPQSDAPGDSVFQ